MQNTFKYRVAQVVSGEYKEFDTVPVCSTPELVRAVGFSDGEIHITQKHIRNCLAPEETSTDDEHHHDLPIDFVDNLPKYIAEPAMILPSLTQPTDSVVLVTDCKDKKDHPIIIALKDNGRGRSNGRVISCNVLTSMYGKDSFQTLLKNSLMQGLLYWNEKKSRDLVVSAGLQLPRVLAKYDSNVIIRRYNENVNPIALNSLDFSPDGYGTTLKRTDGKPFAYADNDGRQKVYEYVNTMDGKNVLRSTSATFSDGRTELTEYNDKGVIIGIERKDASGRTTYKYWSNGFTFSKETREQSFEYHDGRDRYWDEIGERYEPLYKSVHEKTQETEESRGEYYGRRKEHWTDSDEHGNVTRLKHNYGNYDKVWEARDDSYTYDGYGNQTSHVSKDGYASKAEYYSSSEVSDYYRFTPDDYDAGARDYDKLKSEVIKQSDGRVVQRSYEIWGEYTEVEFAQSGKLASFRDVNGKSYSGQAALNAYMKSMGDKAPSFKEIAATANSLRSSVLSGNKNTGKPNGNDGKNGAGR